LQGCFKPLMAERKKAKGLCPLALSHQENDFPGPLINFKINNLTKVQETEFPAGVLEGQSPSIFLIPAIRFSAACQRAQAAAAPHSQPA
jgi:hypothetical protein